MTRPISNAKATDAEIQAGSALSEKYGSMEAGIVRWVLDNIKPNVVFKSPEVKEGTGVFLGSVPKALDRIQHYDDGNWYIEKPSRTSYILRRRTDKVKHDETEKVLSENQDEPKKATVLVLKVMDDGDLLVWLGGEMWLASKYT